MSKMAHLIGMKLNQMKQRPKGSKLDGKDSLKGLSKGYPIILGSLWTTNMAAMGHSCFWLADSN